MEPYINAKIEQAQRAIRYWWLLLAVGIITVSMGIAAFFFPAESYILIATVFGIVTLLSGIAGLTTAITSRNLFATRTWNIAGGIIDILLGILLCANIGISAAVLPYLLGAWLLIRSVMVIGFGGDLLTFGLRGGGWSIATGILLLIFSLVILIRPFAVGIPVVTTLAGIVLLLAGLVISSLAWRMRNIHSHFLHSFPEDIKAEILE